MVSIESSTESAAAPESILTAAAKTVGHAAGRAARAIGWERVDSKDRASHRPKTMRRQSPKRPSPRLRRQDEAAELKAQAADKLPKSSTALGAPYRRVMGKPAANWTAKDVDYVRGMIAKHGAGGVTLSRSGG